MTEQLTRRGFTTKTLGTLLTYTLLEDLANQDLFAAEVKPITKKWLTNVNDLARSVKNRKIKQVTWQKQVEELFEKVELADLLQMVDFKKLAKGAKFVESGARSLRFEFPKIEGLPTEYVFGRQIFALKKGRSVVPHGHDNMATAFLILDGKLRGRHYDRVEDREKEYVIRPTIDKMFGPGGTPRSAITRTTSIGSRPSATRPSSSTSMCWASRRVPSDPDGSTLTPTVKSSKAD